MFETKRKTDKQNRARERWTVRYIYEERGHRALCPLMVSMRLDAHMRPLKLLQLIYTQNMLPTLHSFFFFSSSLSLSFLLVSLYTFYTHTDSTNDGVVSYFIIFFFSYFLFFSILFSFYFVTHVQVQIRNTHVHEKLG